MFSARFVTAAGPAANGMYLSSPNFSAFQAGYNDLLAKYVAKTGGNPPQAFHAHGYDAVNILFAALEKVAVPGEDGTLYVPLASSGRQSTPQGLSRASRACSRAARPATAARR